MLCSWGVNPAGLAESNMTAYHRVHSYGHLWGDCLGPVLASEPCDHTEYGTFPYFVYTKIRRAV